MARAGRKYPLVVYRHLVNRWWFALIFMGIALFGWAYIEYRQPPEALLLLPFILGPFLVWPWHLLIAIGVLAILVGIFFWLIRFIAYVQPYPNYLKLVTPFLRINISYKRIKKTTATEMRYLFPLKGISGAARDIFEQLATKTALVIELTGYPISPTVLRLFLYRFFFKDKTSHLVIVVEDWMRFSSELESMRSGIDPNPPVQKKKRSKDSILSRLPQK
ncbi:MAG TPA: hypothetical protein VLE49_07100 [Anaerolineales bacterium]|nr:hypothetical protein [Anaerolineales bacterium]